METPATPADCPELERLKKTSHDLTELVKKQKTANAALHDECVKKANADVEKASQEFNRVNNLRKAEYIDPSQADGTVDLHKALTKDDKLVEFQKACDNVYFLNALMKSHDPLYDIRASRNPMAKQLISHFNRLQKATAQNTVADSNWLPTTLSGQYYTFVSLETVVPNIFPTIPQTSATMDVPIATAGQTAYLASENQNSPGANQTISKLTASKVTLTKKKLCVANAVSYEMVEDSLVPILSVVQQDMFRALAEGLETAMINGDTAGTHQDTNVTAANDARKAFLGLRAWAADESFTTAATGTIVIGDFTTGVLTMDKYAVPPKNIVCITSPMGAAIIRKFSDLQTVDKYGQFATLLTGEIGQLAGVKIIVSGQVPKNLNASGLYDGTTTDNTVWILVRTDAFIRGSGNQTTIETGRNILTQQIEMVGTSRDSFVSRFPAGLTDGQPIEVIFDVD